MPSPANTQPCASPASQAAVSEPATQGVEPEARRGGLYKLPQHQGQALAPYSKPQLASSSPPEPSAPSQAVAWIKLTAAQIRSGETVTQRLALLEIFGGQPRPWSMTGATQKLAQRLQAPRGALSLDRGFEPSEDVLEPALQADILVVISAGAVEVLWIATPCESVCIMWTRHGPHPFRSRWEPDGRADMPNHWRNYAAMHNAFIALSGSLFRLQHAAGRTCFIENVVDVGNPRSPYYQRSKRHHVSLWITSWMQALARDLPLRWGTTDMCGWLGRFHKPTTVVGAGPKAAAYLAAINRVRCITAVHVLRATDTKPDGTNWSREAGQYPQLFCAYGAAVWLSEWLADPLPTPHLMVLKQQRVMAFLAWFGPTSGASGAPVRDPGAVAPTPTSLEVWWDSEESQALTAHKADAEQAGAAPATAPELIAWQSAHDELPAAWPESEDVQSAHVSQARSTTLGFISRRRAAPELAEVLARRPLPHPYRMVYADVNVTYERAAPWPTGWPPRPIAAEQVWLDGVYADMLEAIRAFVTLSFMRARPS